MDRATANLPSRDFDKTEAFYEVLGFSTRFKDDGWMIMQRGPLEIEFFPHAELDPRTSCFSACLRVDDLDALYAAFQKAALPNNCWATPRMDEPEVKPWGMRMFHVVDLDGSLLRCIDNRTTREAGELDTV
jgi:catechol 2,3-dioxygenase-like lactoylglutathione lyase family enzyme